MKACPGLATGDSTTLRLHACHVGDSPSWARISTMKDSTTLRLHGTNQQINKSANQQIKMKKLLQLTTLLFLLAQNNQAQSLISSEFLSNVSKAALESQYPGTPFISGIDQYLVLYTTYDVNGQLDTASGLFVIPDDPNFIYPLLNYQHGTVGSRWDVPSQFGGGYEHAQIFGGLGYATAAPDYLGLGYARGLHPYVHAETEARAAIDMLFAARQFADENDFLTLNDQLFITGYSQGGHAGAAAHKWIEEFFSNEFTVTAASHMSGPYSISDKMVEFTLGDNEYFFVGYIVYTALSYNMAYDNLFDDLSDFFKPTYTSTIQQFIDEDINLWQMNVQLTTQLIANEGVGEVKPKHLLQDSILNVILNDPDHPVSQALANNDLVDWTPQAPTRLVFCTADDQVYYENAVLAAATMNDNGATDVQAYEANPNANHGECVEPATIFTVLFFSGFQQIDEVVSTQSPLVSEHPMVVVTPNPATDVLHLQLSESTDPAASYEVQVYRLDGQQVYQSRLSGQAATTIGSNDWPTGTYLIKTTGPSGSFSQKLLIGD